MIELTRTHSSAAPTVKVFGLGGAGGNTIDRLILDGFDPNLVVTLNTDLQALNGSVAPAKVHLGKMTTRGLGTGGDPEVGYAAAEEAVDEISASMEGVDMVFICAGLGGGTGSGAAPLVSHLARKAGATVIALVTLPFSFEGKRRSAQAAEALAQLEQQANLVLCFENDAMSSIVAPTAGIQQAFVATDQTLSQTVRALIGVVQRRGLVTIGLDDLTTALGRPRNGAGVRCLFGHGESDTANRAHEALERAMRNPLMDKGKMLADAQHVVVHVSGGPDLTLNEVSVLMEEFNRYISESTRVSFGVATDAKLGRRLCVAVLSSAVPVGASITAVKSSGMLSVPVLEPRHASAPVVTSAPDFFPEPASSVHVESYHAPEEKTDEPSPSALPEEVEQIRKEPVAPAARKYVPAAGSSNMRGGTSAAKKEEKAEQMTLEPANRGRFEKSEPTIVDGEDLDVPTFLRKNVRRN